MYYKSLYYVFLLLNYFTYSFAVQCGGGSVLRSELFGGSDDDSVLAVNLDSNQVFRMAGQTSNGTWSGNPLGATLPDYWVGVIDTVNNAGAYRVLDAGQDNLNNAHLTESHICIAGTSQGLDYLAVWSAGVNITSTPLWYYSGVFTGINYDEGYAVVCTSDQATLVSAVDAAGDGRPQIVVKQFTMQGSAIQNFTYGGSDKDIPYDAAFQGGVLAIVGQTLSTDFQVTSGATQSTKMAGNDAFVMAVNATNGNILFATYYGGNGDEYAYAVALDESGYLYVCGYTSSQDLVLPNAFSTSQSGISDAWLGIWSPQGTLVLATLFGSDGSDQAKQVELLRLYDGSHLVFLAGTTDGTNFPAVESFNGTFGLLDAFVLAYRVTADYSSGSLTFSTRFGGSDDDMAYGLSVTSSGQIAIGGSTASANFPANGTYQGSLRDAFYTVFDCPALIPVPPSPSPSPQPSTGTVTCQTSDGCFQAQDVAVQYTESTNGGYIPTQTLYPVDTTSNTINNETSLAVSYNKLEERDSNGNPVQSETFPTDGWQLTVSTQDVGGSQVTVVQFNSLFVSGANITILNYLFEEDTSFSFAGVTFPVSGSSTESNIMIQNWPFQSDQNTLHLTVDLGISPPPSPVQSSVAGEITQYAFDTGVSTCQVSVLSKAVLDESNVAVSTSVSSTQIEVAFPYFANSVVYDPGYSVLVNNQEENKDKKKKEPISMWAYVGAGIGVVVIAAIFTGFLLTFMQKRKRRQRAATRAAIQHATEQMNSSRASSSEVSTF